MYLVPVMENEVILVNENDEAVGRMEKLEAHQKAVLHRAFSVFIFNHRGEMLLQQRAESKYHSGGLWTNACCSHPSPGEETGMAAVRRLKQEMGFAAPIQKIFDFVYKSEFDNGLTEYEFDHVFAGIYEGSIQPDPAEVQDYRYQSLSEIESALTLHPALYTAWFHIAFPKVKQWAEMNLSVIQKN